MTTEIAQLILVLLTVLGAVGAAVLGWAESGEPFNPRKFASSLGRAIIAGLLSSLIFQGETKITVWLIVIALLTGAGVDVIGHRGVGAIKQLKDGNKQTPKPENPTDPEKETEPPT